MNENNFPLSVLTPLLKYAQNPTASTGTHLPLMQALKNIDAPQTDMVMVSQVSEGQLFRLNQKVFVRGTLRRTRVVCVEEASQKNIWWQPMRGSKKYKILKRSEQSEENHYTKLC